MRRMDRYNNDNLVSTSSRRDKNEELYKEVNSNVKYTNVTDVSNANAYDITSKDEITSKTSREDYHKFKDYASISNELKEKKQLEEFNYLYKDKENKVYDINTVMEEARKNRKEADDLESKRKLQNTNYNILAGLNQDELEKYRKEKKERVVPPDEDEIREIIDTITSKTLAGDISKETSINLLSDLMATQALDRVAAQASEQSAELDITEIKYQTITDKDDKLDSEDVEKLSREKQEATGEVTGEVTGTTLSKVDTDFYTKSMDLSDKDFTLYDDDDDRPMSIVFKIIIIILVLAILAAAGFYIYTHYFK